MQPLKRQPSGNSVNVIAVYIAAANEKEDDGTVSPAVKPFPEKKYTQRKAETDDDSVNQQQPSRWMP